MKKYLSIENSQGIYVARASFSSNETTIDFANNNISKISEDSKLNLPAIEAAPIVEKPIDTTPIVAKSVTKKKRFDKVLKVLHLRKKSTKREMNNKADEEQPVNDVASASTQSLSPAKFGKNKSRTTALVKKFSIIKKSTNGKKSSIPIRTATSAETISHPSVLNRQQAIEVPISSTSTLSLVNIDYRQENGSGNDLNVKFDHNQTIGFNNGGNENIDIIGSDGRRSTDQLQITILGKKQNHTELIKRTQPKLERMQQQQKLNITHDFTTLNRTIVPPEPTTKALSIPYQISSGKIKSAVQNTNRFNSNSTTKTIMQSPAIDVDDRTVGGENKSLRQFSVVATSFDCDEQEFPLPPQLTSEETKNSLLLEIIEAERRNSMSNTPGTSNVGTAISNICNVSDAIASNEENAKASSSVVDDLQPDNQITGSLKMDIDSSTIELNTEPSTAQETTDLSDIKSSSPRQILKFEVGKQVRPTIISNTNLLSNYSTSDKDPTTISMSFKQDYTTNSAGDTNHTNTDLYMRNNNTDTSIVCTSEVPTTSDTIANDHQLPKECRRKISYITETYAIKTIGSSLSSTNCEGEEEEDTQTEDSDQFRLDSTQYSDLNTQTTFIADFLMPAYGDLVWNDDGRVNMASSPEKREHLYKILVIGELGTGKTSFIKRYVHQFFSQNYRATIGVDFALKVLNWDQNTIIRLQLWDIAGQERFGNMTRVYYKEAVGAFIVFDVTRSATFDAVIKWKQDLDSKVQLPNGGPIPCILLANKCDQAKQGIVNTPAKMDDYVKEHGFAGWFETSAKENINIEEAARALVNKILLNDKLINAGDIMDSEKFNLDGQNGDHPKKNCSC